MSSEQDEHQLEVVAYSAACLVLAAVVGDLSPPGRWVGLIVIALLLVAINYRFRRLTAHLGKLAAKSDSEGSPPAPRPN